VTRSSNVRLKTNILCTRVYDETGKPLASRGPDEIRLCLTYFELLALRRARPFLYLSKWLEHDQLTSRQRRNHYAFLVDYRELPWNPVLEGFRPVSAIDRIDENDAMSNSTPTS
jgi:hypothetical protein